MATMAQVAPRGEEAALPQWIRILPRGRVELVDQREPLLVDDESLAAMVADFRGRGVDLVIDYEHQSLKGQRAPAAGWIKDLEARPDGLWARVEWTPQAREYLERREYRYFSPVLRLNPETRQPLTLMQVGLNNVPAIKRLPPLVARCGGASLAALEAEPGGGEEKEKMLDELKRLTGLSPEAEEEAVWGRTLEVFRDLAAVLNLSEEASASQLKGAAVALKASSERLLELQAELQVLKQRLADEATAQAVAEALKAGKISPAQQGWAWQYFRQDPEGFKTYVALAPKLVPTGDALHLLGDEPRDGGELLPEELALCRSLNLPPGAYLKAKVQTSKAQ